MSLKTQIISTLYLQGLNIVEVSKESGHSIWTVRITLKKLGLTRSKKESIQLAKQKNSLTSKKPKAMSYADECEKKESSGSLLAHQLLNIAYKRSGRSI